VAAWSDGSLAESERTFVSLLSDALDLERAERNEVNEWLSFGPPEVDPTLIAPGHRKLFLEIVEGVVGADGVIHSEEKEMMALLRELLA
jgi:uncharacterized tellurite resistance protein B-like protein